MSEFAVVTLLYTANIKGKLALLPRLATLIRRERQASEGLVLLLDVGDTCAADVWICRATLGRAPLLVLDAIGYDAALVGGPEKAPIPPEALRHLRETAGMLTPIWGRPARLLRRGVEFAVVTVNDASPIEKGVIMVDRTRPTAPDVGTPGAILGDVHQGVLARVDMTWPEWTVRSVGQMSIEPGVPPDPSIAAVIELVENEARYLAEQQGDV